MRGRGNNDAEHVERDERNYKAWDACRDERLAIRAELIGVYRTFCNLADRYDGMTWEHKLEDDGYNGVIGHQSAHGVWRGFHGVGSNLRSLIRSVVRAG